MPTGKRGAICRGCHKTFPSRAHLSKRYLCDECGEARAIASRHEVAAKQGEAYERWRAGMRRALDA